MDDDTRGTGTAIGDMGTMGALGIDPAQVQRYLEGLDYPATKEDILRVARDNGADANTLDTLESIDDEVYTSPNEISDAIGTANADIDSPEGLDEEDME